MTYGHLQAECLYTGISSVSNARRRVWEAFTFTFLPIALAIGLYNSLYYRTSRDINNEA